MKTAVFGNLVGLEGRLPSRPIEMSAPCSAQLRPAPPAAVRRADPTRPLCVRVLDSTGFHSRGCGRYGGIPCPWRRCGWSRLGITRVSCSDPLWGEPPRGGAAWNTSVCDPRNCIGLGLGRRQTIVLYPMCNLEFAFWPQADDGIVSPGIISCPFWVP